MGWNCRDRPESPGRRAAPPRPPHAEASAHCPRHHPLPFTTTASPVASGAKLLPRGVAELAACSGVTRRAMPRWACSPRMTIDRSERHVVVAGVVAMEGGALGRRVAEPADSALHPQGGGLVVHVRPESSGGALEEAFGPRGPARSTGAA